MNHNKHRKFTEKLSISVISTLFLIILSPIWGLFLDKDSKFLLLPSFVFILLFNFFYASQFACAALAIRERLKLLNVFLRFVIHNELFKFFNFFGFRFSLTRVSNDENTIKFSCDLKYKMFSDTFNDLCDALDLNNSIFTFHIVFVVTSFLLTNIFAAYLILRELLSKNSFLGHLVPAACIFIALQYLIKNFIAYVGNSTTVEAEKSLKIITKALGSMEFESKLKMDLNFFLIQFQCRNKNVQNIFFVINWKFILAVSINN